MQFIKRLSVEINWNLLAELEAIYSILAQGCRKIRGAEFLEEIWYLYFSETHIRELEGAGERTIETLVENVQAM